MDDVPEEEIAEVGRLIVAGIAPQELLLYRMHSQEFFKNPDRALAPPKPREDAMGFGLEQVVNVVTPFVLLALCEVVRAMGEEARRQLGKNAVEGTSAFVRRLFGKAASCIAPLSPEQLKRVHDIALANAGSDPALAHRIADGIVAALNQPPAKAPASG